MTSKTVILVVLLSLAAGQSTNDYGSPADDAIQGTVSEPKEEEKPETTPDSEKQPDEDDVTAADWSKEMIVLLEALGEGSKDVEMDFMGEETNPAGDAAKDGTPDGDPESTSDTISDATEEQMQIRRTGDIPDYRQGPNDQNDEAPRNDPENRYTPPYQSQSAPERSDGVPLLQLTQGGYQRPYGGQPRDRQVQQNVPQRPEPTSDNEVRPQTVPQVTYSAPQYAFGPSPVLRRPGAFMGVNGITPNNIQGPLLNPLQGGFGDFGSFQSQYPAASDVPGFVRDANGMPFFQNPYQNPGLLFQNFQQFTQAPQPIASDPPRTFQAGFPSYNTFETVEDAARPDYAPFFRSPVPPPNPQFQIPPNFYASSPAATGGNVFSSPPILPNYPRTDVNSGLPYPPRFLRYPISNVPQGMAQPNEKPPSEDPDKAKDPDQINESPNKEDPSSVPYGTRLPTQSNDVYIRYPTRDAGYATEENLLSQNTTGDVGRDNNNDQQRPTLPFFQVFSSRDPYRDALNTLQQGSLRNTDNATGNFPSDQAFRAAPSLPFDYPQPPSQVFVAYPERNQDISTFPSPAFYPATDVDAGRSPFRELTSLPEGSYRFFSSQRDQPDTPDADEIPLCARQNNASMCFEDENYPKREILYAINSNSFLLERLASPTLQMDEVNLIDRNATDETKAEEKYICQSDIKYGAPLRAKSASGQWKVIVNVDRAGDRGRFAQPLRLEVCRGSGQACSYTDSRVKTTCVQKYSVQRLLSWSRDRGVHNDVYKLPVACSCQIVEAL